MMLNKEVISTTKGFDETFFMYGEDIDLSYRVQQAGYKTIISANKQLFILKEKVLSVVV